MLAVNLSLLPLAKLVPIYIAGWTETCRFKRELVRGSYAVCKQRQRGLKLTTCRIAVRHFNHLASAPHSIIMIIIIILRKITIYYCNYNIFIIAVINTLQIMPLRLSVSFTVSRNDFTLVCCFRAKGLCQLVPRSWTSCTSGAPRHVRLVRHNHLNDFMHRSLSRAGIFAIKEPWGLLRADSKRPDRLNQHRLPAAVAKGRCRKRPLLQKFATGRSSKGPLSQKIVYI